MQDMMCQKNGIVKAALKCAEDKSWNDVTFVEIAQVAGLPLSDVHGIFKTKREILQAFSQLIDAEVLKQIQSEGQADLSSDNARDRLFNVLMTRFEVMQSYKKALARIYQDLRYGKMLSEMSLRQFCGSQSWMLTAAHIQASGVKGSVRLAGLSTLYLRAFPVWLKDEEPGLPKNMAFLDKALRDGEGAVKRFDHFWDEGTALMNRLCRVVRPEKTSSRDKSPVQDISQAAQTSTDSSPQEM